MPARLPGSTDAQNNGNPSAGPVVVFSPINGVTNAPQASADQSGAGMGLSTGIGYGQNVIGITAPASIIAAGFTDNYVPGLTLPGGGNASDARLMMIGGGRTNADGSPGTPWSAGSGLLAAGNGGNRDAGGAPGAGAGFNVKTVTAPGSVVNGAVVEAGFVNRSGQSLTTGQSVFGSSVAASTVPA
jgi:hypothetical protein